MILKYCLRNIALHVPQVPVDAQYVELNISAMVLIANGAMGELNAMFTINTFCEKLHFYVLLRGI